MQLSLDEQQVSLTPIRYFRETHELPAAFGVPLFEPKDTAGRGSIEDAGADLNHLKSAMLAAIPAQVTRANLLDAVQTLTDQFRTELNSINDAVGLNDEEVEFAVAGFSDVLQAWAYALIRWQPSGGFAPEFATIYQQWHADSVRLSQRVHEYTHDGETWQVQIINDAYGRIGLRVTMPDDTIAYVQDEQVACPAAGFMYTLLNAVAIRLKQTLVPAAS